jgi:hypothetical protein
MLTIDGKVPEEIRVIRFCDALAESGISLLEGEQLGVFISGVGQGTSATAVRIAPGGKGGGGDDRGECRSRKEGVKRKSLAEHVKEC